MSTTTHLTRNQALALAQSWRMGADDVRQQFRNSVTQAVPFSAEMAACTLELCATRLEQAVTLARPDPQPAQPSTLNQQPTNAS
jgi:hypothetical protein